MPNKRAEGRITPTISVEGALWDAAKVKAASQDTNLSAVVGALLRRWVDGDITISEDT